MSGNCTLVIHRTYLYLIWAKLYYRLEYSLLKYTFLTTAHIDIAVIYYNRYIKLYSMSMIEFISQMICEGLLLVKYIGCILFFNALDKYLYIRIRKCSNRIVYISLILFLGIRSIKIYKLRFCDIRVIGINRRRKIGFIYYLGLHFFYILREYSILLLGFYLNKLKSLLTSFRHELIYKNLFLYLVFNEFFYKVRIFTNKIWMVIEIVVYCIIYFVRKNFGLLICIINSTAFFTHSFYLRYRQITIYLYMSFSTCKSLYHSIYEDFSLELLFWSNLLSYYFILFSIYICKDIHTLELYFKLCIYSLSRSRIKHITSKLEFYELMLLLIYYHQITTEIYKRL